MRNTRRGLACLTAGAAVVALSGLAGCSSGGDGKSGDKSAERRGTAAPAPTGAAGLSSGAAVPAAFGTDTALPPWPVPQDMTAGARAAGLQVGGVEGTVQHFHAHLDILVDGEPVTVPGGIGISEAQRLISELHTHQDDGVVHVEAPTAGKRYFLGQVFDEWQVKLTAGGMGGLKTGGGKALSAYVNGKKVDGDPAAILLQPHQEIVLVYGPAGATPKVPSSFEFAPGE